MFQGLKIVIGITGGISAYKACGLISYLKSEGANLEVIMTKHAQEFISSLTIETLAGQKVITDMFANVDHSEVKHITLAKEADLIIIIPATANIIGKVANGIADDMLSTTIIATKSPVIFLPAMNVNMYENPIVQNNIEKLKKYGYQFIEPKTGKLACGDTGKGKLPKTEEIVKELKLIIKEGTK